MNVFGWDKGNVIIRHFSKQSGDINRINLLLIEKGECFHYTWIKDLDRLLYNQSKHRECKFFLPTLSHWSREDLLNNHKLDCQGIGRTAVRIDMPSEEKSKLKFKHFYKQQKAPYIIYADFEALTRKVEGAE